MAFVRTIVVTVEARASPPVAVFVGGSEVKILPVLPVKNNGETPGLNVPLNMRAAVFHVASPNASPVAQAMPCGLVSEVNAGPIEFEPSGLAGYSGAPFVSVPTP